jgi:hypothetical protein
MAHSAKHLRTLKQRNERILRNAAPKTKDGAPRGDKVDAEGTRLQPSFLRRYRDRYETMPHRPMRHGIDGCTRGAKK